MEAKEKIVLGLVGVLATCKAVPHIERNSYEVTVTDTEVVRNAETSTYLVFTEQVDGGVRVFSNQDSLYEGKWNSSDFQAEFSRLKGTDTVIEVDTYGWRIPFLSKYENIISYDIK